MIDLQKVVDAMGGAARDARSDYHLTLGRLIDWLSGIRGDLMVRVDYETETPGLGDPISYRGHYCDLAFEPSQPRSVSAILADCHKALGNTFEGYKGGDYEMDEDTPLWHSAYGQTDRRALIGLRVTDTEVIVNTLEVGR